MKIAVISDIHGNLAALDAVLADIDRQQVDLTVNLGDILSGALQPCATADRLMARNFPTIRGNHERQILEGETTRLGASDLYARATLRADQLAWLASLPLTLQFDRVLMVHGTPSSDLTYFLETVTSSGCRAATQEEILARAGVDDVSLILCGHTHVPRVVRLDDGRLIVNPGSVGLPAYRDIRPYPHRIENGAPHARYAVVDDGSGTWQAELLAVSYDWEAAAALALAHGRADWVAPLTRGFCEPCNAPQQPAP
ncbi:MULTISPECIES: metallophosphoesterase family protein [unclassified Undibacterium]|uniref:metallophosphoesterase family protein n=1 Tax=unclassified Undibacterium TaxID=2630295 RepID=UPI002AC9582C|nr:MULTISPECIES: metallophosphoesterase family protein [unclassified Undibacterium]MEB0139058.1 metallophosphoesterase family protein [Undibacterium sp. CCC2.1]MEB0172985.1 metallophosphoesterase family protein [Undibacterium sp. CCC1.1]MEB0177307.1 metallophosphoesterase family protein [Undibacterium sp. CCC3.4]MEB0215903.1 metallophosphoesterase family protein [Undibacterium sp. 5I2]WPX42104.1 metallophosphoesterase family protein [Undibacterium sp. CCC3.4]